jgi:hypothetical protein
MTGRGLKMQGRVLFKILSWHLFEGRRKAIRYLLREHSRPCHSPCLPIAEARVRDRVRSCGICGGHSGTGAGFLRVLRFPLPIFIPSIAPQSPLSIIWGCYNRLVVTAVPSGLKSHTTKVIKKE